MKRLVVDRFEGKYAICQDENGGMFGIELNEIPKDAKEGSVIDINDDGEISVNSQETNKRIKRISEKTSKLFNK